MDITRKETYQFSSGEERSEVENKIIIQKYRTTDLLAIRSENVQTSVTVSYSESDSSSSSSSYSDALLSSSCADFAET